MGKILSFFLGGLGRQVKRFHRRRDGVAAIEFALVGPIYLTLLLAMVEAGFLLIRTALLDDATSQAAKFIYIGEAGSGEVEPEEIVTFVCDKVGAFVGECEENISLEATPVSNFTDLPDTDAQCQDNASEEDFEVPLFNTGSANSIMFLRICVTTDIIMPGLGFGLQMTQTDTGRYQLISSTAFVNEPF